MAEVFLALQRGEFGLEKLVVVKCLLPNLSEETRFIEMFLDEARTAATLTHPNIAQVFDVGEVEGTYFIAMEFVEGRDLRSLRRARRAKGQNGLPFAHAIYITKELLAGLDYAHQKKDLGGAALDIVHRDVSPQNVLLDFAGSVKIVDFGVAKSAMQLGEKTGVGELKGKVAYMSPEQARGQQVDWRTDLFAASVLLFEMTTGKRLFYGKSDVETLRRIYACEYPRPSELIVNYPEELEGIVLRGLCKDRRLRYQSARDMQVDLQRFAERAGLTLSQSEFSDWVRQELDTAYNELQTILAEVRLLAGRPESVVEGLARRNSSRPPPNGAQESGAARDSEGPPSSTLRGSTHTVTSEPTRRRRLGRYAAAAVVSGAVVGAAIFGGWLPPPPGMSGERISQARATAASWTGRTFGGVWRRLGNQEPTAPAPAEAEEAVLTTTLTLEVQPANASVWLDGKPLQARRASVTRTKAHELRVSAAGYEPKIVELWLSQHTEHVRVALKRLSDMPNRPRVESVSD
jgi:serine/threonine-protein kinase